MVAGLISRAYPAPDIGLNAAQAATVLDALDTAADQLRDIAANCGDCDAAPDGLCGTCDYRLARAAAFDALAAAVRRQT